MRRAKIIATLGPATAAPGVLAGLLRAGVDVARLNLSHGDHAEHARVIARTRCLSGGAKSSRSRHAMSPAAPA